MTTKLLYIHATEETIRTVGKSIRTACEDLGINADQKIGVFVQGCEMRFDGVGDIRYAFDTGDESYYYIIVEFSELNREVEIPVCKKFVDYVTTERRCSGRR